VHQALLRVKGLKKGEIVGARETPDQASPDEVVLATLPHLSPIVQVMVQVQILCGCRPQDIVEMKAADIDTRGSIWEYRPARYKTDHLNEDDDPDLDRVVYLGPRAQETLETVLAANPQEFLFSPKQAKSDEPRKEDSLARLHSGPLTYAIKLARKKQVPKTTASRPLRPGILPQGHPSRLRQGSRAGLASPSAAPHQIDGIRRHFE